MPMRRGLPRISRRSSFGVRTPLTMDSKRCAAGATGRHEPTRTPPHRKENRVCEPPAPGGHRVVLRGRRVGVLSGGVIAASLLVQLLLIRRVRGGASRLVESFLISTEGDLSTPTEAAGLSDITDIGEKIDSARSWTLSRIREIAAEAEFLRSEPLSEEEFAKRWNVLKATVRKVAP